MGRRARRPVTICDTFVTDCTYSLPVEIADSGQNGKVVFKFTVVESLTHDCIYGLDFLAIFCNGAVLDSGLFERVGTDEGETEKGPFAYRRNQCHV